jgi:diguanylate cyclase
LGLRASFERLKAILGEKQHRPFVWVCAICLLVGVIDFGAPVDDTLRAMRNRLRVHPASGQFVLLMPDDPKRAEAADWSWSRGDVARLVTEAQRAGVHRIAIARLLPASASNEKRDVLFNALASLPRKPVIAMSFEVDGETGERRVIQPPADLARVAEVAVVNLYFNGFGRVESVPYLLEVGDKKYRSFASILSGRTGASGNMAPIDYATDIGSVPVISEGTLLTDSGRESVAGKTIVIASSESLMNVNGRGRVPAAYAHILGVETLRNGRPADLGWLPAFAIGLGCAMAVWFGRRRIAVPVLVGTLLGFLLLPVVLEANMIFVDTVSGLLVVLGAAAIRSYRSYRRAGTRENTLTGLPNLAAFKERVLKPGEAVVVGKIANYAELVSVVSVNERLLAEQIIGRLSGGTRLSLYHGDGGIFAWIVPANEIESLGDHLDALHAFFLKPVSVSGWQVDVTVAFGVDVGAGKDMPTCVACAMVAADEAVENQHRWKYYDAARLDQAEWNVSLLGKLDTAIMSGEVWVAYQPKVDVRTRTVTGFEALVRWSHPERGAISPEKFVSVAESHGRIDSLTYFVLDDALRMLGSLGLKGGSLGVAVNLSVRMFERRDFIENVQKALERHAIAPGRLTMEITESAEAENEEQMLQCIAALAKMGVKVSIDDYGTGYSTLEYLKKVKAAELKIDRGFVIGMERNRSDFMLVKATIDLAHSLGHRVVAEGVETETTFKLLQDLGCDLAQGYLIARPMPRHELRLYLKNQRTPLAA